MAKPLNDSAVLVHKRAYRENSSIAVFFTPNFGRISLVVRGAANSKSGLRSSIQPFNLLNLSFSHKPGGLGYVISADLTHEINMTGESALWGMYINELIYRLLTENEPDLSLFEDYVCTLRTISTDRNVVHLRFFESSILHHLGYGIDDQDIDGVAVDSDSQYGYDPSRGFTLCKTSDGGQSVSGAAIIAIASGSLATLYGATKHQLREAHFILKGAIARHLGNKPLKSSALLRSLKRL